MGEAHVKGVRGSGDFVGDSEAKTWGWWVSRTLSRTGTRVSDCTGRSRRMRIAGRPLVLAARSLAVVRQWGGGPREQGPVEGVGGEGFREAPCRGEGRAGKGGNRGGNKRDLYGACFPSFLFLFFFFL